MPGSERVSPIKVTDAAATTSNILNQQQQQQHHTNLTTTSNSVSQATANQNGPLCSQPPPATTNPPSSASSSIPTAAVHQAGSVTTNGVAVPTSFNPTSSANSQCNSCLEGSPPGSIAAVARSPTAEAGGPNGEGFAQAAAVPVHSQPPPPQHHQPGDVVSATPVTHTATATSNGGSANSKASPRESGEDSEDESEILEESPCGRWLKRREEVEQRDVPGIDCAHLAMDTEEGVEVVWNEVQFSERRNFKAQEEKIQQVFENLTQLEHPNIVKFHRYWTDTHNDKPRVIFITEYMSSGSLKQFLKRTKRNVKRLPLQAWRRWCTQILSALSYLHSCTPPIIHGNLTCDTIFIQHNGLVKIGSVAPDAIHHHVKTCRENMKNMHFIAPEYGTAVTPAIDIYSFGMCALEMAALEIQGNGDSGTLVTDEQIAATIDSLDHAQQKDFILKCLNKDPADRHSARELLFHSLLFEVHSLKLLAAHCLVDNTPNFSETLIDEMMQRCYKPDAVVAEITRSVDAIEMRLTDVPTAEKLEKFVEDVRYGIYPLTAFAARQPPPQRPRAVSPETIESVKSVSPEPLEIETRKAVFIMCEIKPREDSCDLMMQIILRMDDKMNRQLTCQISEEDTPASLSEELVRLGFISDVDREKIAAYIEDKLRLHFSKRQQHLLNMGSGGGAASGGGGGGLIQGVIESAVGSDLHHHHHLPMSVHTTSIERNWTVADSESPSSSGASILEGGASVLSGGGGGGRRPGTGGSSSGGVTSDGPSTPATDGISTTVLASPVGSSTPGFTPVAQHMINPMEVLTEGGQAKAATSEKEVMRPESIEAVNRPEMRQGSEASSAPAAAAISSGERKGDHQPNQHQLSK